MEGSTDDKKISAEDISLFWVGEDTSQAKKGWHSPTLGWEIKKPCDCTIEIDNGESVERYEHVESSGELDLDISKKTNRISIKVTCDNGSKLTKTITLDNTSWYSRIVSKPFFCSFFAVLFYVLFIILMLDWIFSLVCDIIEFPITPPAIYDDVLIPICSSLFAILCLVYGGQVLLMTVFSALRYINQSLSKLVWFYMAIIIFFAIIGVVDYLLPHYASYINFILFIAAIYLLVKHAKSFFDGTYWIVSGKCDIIEADGTISNSPLPCTWDYMLINRLYRQASKGNKKSQTGLAYIYHEGDGLRQDYEKSVKWLSDAAAKGSKEGKFYLALCYLCGDGVEEDKQKAVELFTAAAEQGFVRAQYWLGWCYMKGQGTPIDSLLAKKWLSKAASKGDSEAKESLKELENETIS